MTLVEYLYRVIGYLLAFAGFGVTIFWGLRAVGIVQSELSRRVGIDDSES